MLNFEGRLRRKCSGVWRLAVAEFLPVGGSLGVGVVGAATAVLAGAAAARRKREKEKKKGKTGEGRRVKEEER